MQMNVTTSPQSINGAWRDSPLSLRMAMVVSVIATFSITLRPHALILKYPFIEDAYYAFSVSRNLAGGNGLTIDGDTWTNGFQPLTTILNSLVFLLPLDDSTSLRAILLVQWIILVATAALIGLIVRTYLASAPGVRFAFGAGFLSYLGSFYVINTSLNGLETGAVLFGYAALWRFIQVKGVTSIRNAAWCGLIAGLLGLVRIDSLLVIAVMLVGILLTAGILRAMTTAVVAGGVVLPWLVYGFVLTGNWVPTSGRAQTAVEFSSFRLERLLEALSATGFPWLPLSTIVPGASILIRLALAALLLGCFLWLRHRVPSSDLTRRTELFAVLLGLGVLILATYYSITSFAFWFYGRYAAPLALLTAFLLAVVTVIAGKSVIAAASVGLTIVAVAASAAHWLPGLYQENSMYTEQVALVHETVPADELVSATQTGTLGFFRPRTVNLDGKVNAEVLDFQSDIDAYLEQNRIRWFCDWPRQFESALGQSVDNWTVVAKRGEYICALRTAPPLPVDQN